MISTKFLFIFDLINKVIDLFKRSYNSNLRLVNQIELIQGDIVKTPEYILQKLTCSFSGSYYQ